MNQEDWDDYRFFLAVAQSGSLSAAARSLGVSQPTVSRRIASLEERLDVRLFDHLANKGVEITAVGKDIVDLAATLEATAHTLKRKVAGRETDLAGEVVVTTTEGFAAFWLSDRIAKFCRQYPDISITCLADNQILNLARREADVAIRFGEPRTSSLFGCRVGHTHCGIYGSKAYLEKHGIPGSTADLANHRLIGTAEPISRFAQSQIFEGMMADSIQTCKTNSSHASIALASAGMGLIGVSCYMAQSSENLIRVLTDDYDIQIELWMLTHQDLKNCARIRVFMDFVKDELRADAEVLTGQTSTN